jgi:hypothetical protein
MKMRNAFVMGGVFALATALGSTVALAQATGGGGMHLSGSASAQAGSRTLVEAEGATSLARADKVTVKRGVKDRDVVRTRGANKPAFCPPGQESKPGLGSRFQC